MCFKLSCYELKISYFNYVLSVLFKSHGNHKQKSIVDTQSVETKESKQTTIESHQIEKGQERKKQRNELQNRHKTTKSQ